MRPILKKGATLASSSTIGLIVTVIVTSILFTSQLCQAKDYYYTRTRSDPNHLRISEEFKNKFVDEIRYESNINGTKYEYFKSTLTTGHDELVFETIDKVFRHRLSPFYIHHYDRVEDKKRSFDPQIVSHEACARDLMYLIDKLPKLSNGNNQHQRYDTRHKSSASGKETQFYESLMSDEDHLTPELVAFFDSYARQEAGLMMGNTYWVGAYDQCINRHIFDLTSSRERPKHQRQQVGGVAEDPDQKVVNFKGRYCVSALKSPKWDTYIKQRQLKNRFYFKSERQFKLYSELFRLQVGICLPDSCESSSLERHADEIKLLTTTFMDERYANYDLVDLYCLPDESSPLRSWSGSAFNFLVFMTFWCIIIFLATIADLFEFVDTINVGKSEERKARRLEQLVVWFSLRANYRKLWTVGGEDQGEDGKKSEDQQPGQQQSSERRQIVNQVGDNVNESTISQQPDLKVNLRFLNAFKALIMFWIVNGHIMLLMIQTAKNILYSDALLNGLMHFLIGATFGVDLFFTMTGFLTSYLIFNSGMANKMRPGTWLYLSFHRYWRLAPMYLLAFWFSRSVVQLLGSGPLWDYGTSALTFRGLCNHQSWWYPLTLTSNLHGLFEESMITSWYISCDMQFWLVSPIFIHLLAKNPLHGWVAAIAAIVMSSKVRYDSILKEASARYDELVKPRADIFMRVSHDLPALYTHPHFRIAAYIVGMLAGHYVFMVKSGKWSSSIVQARRREQEAAALEVAAGTTELAANQTTPVKPDDVQLRAKLNLGFRRRNTMAYVGLFLFTVMSFVSYILSHYFPTSLLANSKSIAAVAYSVDHLVMSIGASLIIISLCFGQWSNIVKFLSHPNWTRLSKMNYALLLLQCEAIYYQIFRYDQMPVAGTRELVNILFNLLVTLYPLAFLVTLMFEFPLANLEKLILPDKKDKRSHRGEEATKKTTDKLEEKLHSADDRIVKDKQKCS